MAKYKTRKMNGIDVVHIKDIPLKYGRISSGNSMPYIRADLVDKLIAMDQGIGEKYYITSAMGGKHAGGPRGHGAAVKLDLVGTQPGGKFSPRAQQFINKYFVGNGAIGWHDAGSGFHNDITLLGGQGGLDNNIIRPTPSIYNSQPIVNDIYMGGQLASARYMDLLKKTAESLAKDPDYDIGNRTRESEQAIQNIQNQAVQDANAQMYQNIESPEAFQQARDVASEDLNKQQALANMAAGSAVGVYQNRLTPEQMNEAYNTQIQKFMDLMNRQNPYNQVQVANPYNINTEAVLKAQNRDRALENYMTSAAMLNAQSNPQLAAIQVEAAKQGGNTAEQLLKNAQLQYQAQVANQLGAPIELVNEQMKHNYKMAENMAQPAATAAKESTIIQPNAMDRTYISEVPKNMTDIYQADITRRGDEATSRIKENELYKDLNKQGAEIIGNTATEQAKMYGKVPELVTDKFGDVIKAETGAYPNLISGTASMTSEAMRSNQNAIEDVNKNLMGGYEEQGRDYRKGIDLVKEAQKTQKETSKEENPIKIASMKEDFKKKLYSNFINPKTGKGRPETKRAFALALQNTGQFSDEEIEELISDFYPREEGKK